MPYFLGGGGSLPLRVYVLRPPALRAYAATPSRFTRTPMPPDTSIFPKPPTQHPKTTLITERIPQDSPPTLPTA